MAAWAAGLVLISFGVAAMFAAALGFGPVDVFCSALAESTGVSMWVAVAVVNVSVAGSAAVIGDRLRPATIAAAAALGPGIGVASSIIGTPASTTSRWLVLITGIVVAAFGAALQIFARLGPAPAEALTVAVSSRFGLHLHTSRWVIEGSALVTGAALGGLVGPGTIAIAVGFAAALSAFDAAITATAERLGLVQVVSEMGGDDIPSTSAA